MISSPRGHAAGSNPEPPKPPDLYFGFRKGCGLEWQAPGSDTPVSTCGVHQIGQLLDLLWQGFPDEVGRWLHGRGFVDKHKLASGIRSDIDRGGCPHFPQPRTDCPQCTYNAAGERHALYAEGELLPHSLARPEWRGDRNGWPRDAHPGHDRDSSQPSHAGAGQ